MLHGENGGVVSLRLTCCLLQRGDEWVTSDFSVQSVSSRNTAGLVMFVCVVFRLLHEACPGAVVASCREEGMISRLSSPR